MEANTGIINALKRLERAGSEHSRTTEKLVAAAELLTAKIDFIFPSNSTCFPRGAQHWNWDGDSQQMIPHDRESALSLARAIATGWLEELATWLEKRGTEDSEAAAVLERAAKAMEVKSSDTPG